MLLHASLHWQEMRRLVVLIVLILVTTFFLFDFLLIANTFQDLAYNFVEKEWNQRPCRDKVCRK